MEKSHNAQEEIEQGMLPRYNTYSTEELDNTVNSRIELRGYGRNIQQMVMHCLTLTDRDERTRCAYSIMKAMERVRPKGYSINTLCDHIYYISGYKLDIDFPNGYVPQKMGNLATSANKEFTYSDKKRFRFRHYGYNIQQAIDKALETEDEAERNELVVLIANQMKRCYVLYNKDTVTDNKIFDDLRDLSFGKFDIKDDELKLIDAQSVLDAQKQSAQQNKQQNNKQQQSKASSTKQKSKKKKKK